MKGVILAGGTGTRLLPFTQIINKHLLPVGPYPMIYWPILKLREAQINDILIITNKRHLHSFTTVLGHGEELNVNLQYTIQKNEGRGIADALLSGQHFIQHEKFIVILGDNMFEDSLNPYVKAFQMQKEGGRVFLKKVPDPERYGVAEIDPVENKLVSIIEKPKNPPSSYCVTGIYMYDGDVFQFINSIRPSKRNELEITDVNNLYIQKGKLEYDILKGWWIDAGTPRSLFEASQLVYETQGGGRILD